MKWWFVCWLILSLVSHMITNEEPSSNESKGNPGDSGSNESKGNRGDSGSNESKGNRGDSGSNESKGNRGDSGSNESKGNRGDSGSNESKGNRGDSCSKKFNKMCDYTRGKGCGNSCKNPSFLDATSCMEYVTCILQLGDNNSTIQAVETLEDLLEEIELNETTSIRKSNFMAFLYKPKGPFEGLKLYASETEVMSERAVTNSKVSVQLPRELDVGSDNTIVLCVLTWPETNRNILGASDKMYESRLFGLSVRGKNISGLHERVNITMNLTMGVNETEKPKCVFFNFSAKEYSSNGCVTLWERGDSHVTCSCDHLTYFGVLMVSASLSSTDQKALTYITLIGCSLSLFALIITVLIFITKRSVRADVSVKVHINLAIALILLNLHFLPSEAVAALSSSRFCIYMALLLHYSLLATFSWMAVEGFHLYLLLIRVFNIYIRKYLLKLSLVGWGIPAVIVSLVVIIDRDAYGPVNFSNHSNTTICYIHNYTVKMVTTVGAFGLVFVFNLIMLVVTVRRVVSLHHHKEIGQSDRDRSKRDICTLLGVTTLLGIPWGLVFFSFGYLTTPGLYLFCILNSLQGFFIFLWFMMSLRKTGNSAKTSSETRTTNT